MLCCTSPTTETFHPSLLMRVGDLLHLQTWEQISCSRMLIPETDEPASHCLEQETVLLHLLGPGLVLGLLE